MPRASGIASACMDKQEDIIRRLRDQIRRQERRKRTDAPPDAPTDPAPPTVPVDQPPAAPDKPSQDAQSATGPPGADSVGPSGPSPIVFRRDLPHCPAPPSWAPSLTAPGPMVSLEQAVGGMEVCPEDGGRFYEVRHDLRELAGGWEDLCEQFATVCGRGSLGRWGLPDQAIDGPADLALLDLETTGLGSCMIFLAGVMSWEGDGLVVRQLLARDYAEEPAVLAALARRLATKRVLVTFNGKSFDWPTCCVRAAANAVAWRMDLAHLDLLHTSRRMLRGRTPDCRLQTLERHLCHRVRNDDIPGSRIPEAYHAFVRTGHAGQLALIMKHNRLDLMTLADLMARLADLDQT